MHPLPGWSEKPWTHANTWTPAPTKPEARWWVVVKAILSIIGWLLLAAIVGGNGHDADEYWWQYRR